MNWEKVGKGLTIGLLVLFIFGVAMATTVTSIKEAKTKLGNKPTIEPLDAEAHFCGKRNVTTTKEADDKAWVVEYSTWYKKDGVKTREKVGSVEVANCNDATIKSAVQTRADAEWVVIQAKYNQTYDSVDIQPAGKNKSPLNEVYDYVAKKWNKLSGVQAE